MIERTTLRADDGRTWEVPNDRLNPWHTVWLSETDYKLAHPLDCDLIECKCDRMLRESPGPPAEPGIYQWTEESGLMYDLYANRKLE